MNETMKLMREMPDGETFDRDNLVTLGKQIKNIYHLWLIDEIGEPKTYLKWFDILQSATEDDLIVIHINSYGGEVWTAVQIITQIKTCQAQVVCQIESACCSAATMIALACDGLMCFPHGYMMIHTSSGFTFGKQSDIKKEEEFYNSWLEKFFHEIYKNFLTKREIAEVLEGKDMWIDADEVITRFRKRVDIINRENARAKREHLKKFQSLISGASQASVDAEDSEKEEKKQATKKPKKGKSKKQSKKEE